MSARKAISKRLRFEVFKRDEFVCQYCGAHPPETILHIDHMDPVVAGGTNDIDNLVTACDACNLGKGARLLTAVPESLANKGARIAEAEDQLIGYQEIMRGRAARIEEEAWEIAERLYPGSGKRGFNSRDLLTIKKFIGRLGLFGVLEMADVALGKKPWRGAALFRYFCGCCWRCIRRLDGSEE